MKNKLFIFLSLLAPTLIHATGIIRLTSGSFFVDEGAGNVAITATRSGDTTTQMGADFATADLSAVSGLKYTATSGTLTFAPGETTKTILVPIRNEGFVEGTKTFRLSLTNLTGDAVLGVPASTTVYITDNDAGLHFEFDSYIEVLQTYALSMFDKYLQAHDDHLLDGPSGLYPEVRNILRK